MQTTLPKPRGPRTQKENNTTTTLMVLTPTGNKTDAGQRTKSVRHANHDSHAHQTPKPSLLDKVEPTEPITRMTNYHQRKHLLQQSLDNTE